METRLERIVSEINLAKLNTVIDQINSLDPNVERPRELSHIPLTSIGFAISIENPYLKTGGKYIQTTYLAKAGTIKDFISAFDCDGVGELAGKPVTVYYQETEIIGMEPR